MTEDLLPADGEARSTLDESARFLAAVEKAARSLISSVTRARKALEGAGEPAQVTECLDAMGNELAVLKTLADQGTTLASVYRRETGDRFLRLEADLREACQVRGWRVDGQWPDLFVELGVAVSIDEAKMAVSVAGRRLRTIGIAGIMKEVEIEAGSLIPSNFDRSSFLELLANAYDSASGGRGGQVSIWDVYRSLVGIVQNRKFWRDARAAKFQGLSVDQFRSRLSRTLESTSAVLGRHLRLFPPLKAEDGLFLYQPSEQRFGYVGRIEFVSDGELP